MLKISSTFIHTMSKPIWVHADPAPMRCEERSRLRQSTPLPSPQHAIGFATPTGFEDHVLLPRDLRPKTRRDSELDFAHFGAPISDGGPKDRRFRDDAHGLFDR